MNVSMSSSNLNTTLNFTHFAFAMIPSERYDKPFESKVIMNQSFRKVILKFCTESQINYFITEVFGKNMTWPRRKHFSQEYSNSLL